VKGTSEKVTLETFRKIQGFTEAVWKGKKAKHKRSRYSASLIHLYLGRKGWGKGTKIAVKDRKAGCKED